MIVPCEKMKVFRFKVSRSMKNYINFVALVVIIISLIGDQFVSCDDQQVARVESTNGDDSTQKNSEALVIHDPVTDLGRLYTKPTNNIAQKLSDHQLDQVASANLESLVSLDQNGGLSMRPQIYDHSQLLGLRLLPGKRRFDDGVALASTGQTLSNEFIIPRGELVTAASRGKKISNKYSMHSKIIDEGVQFDDQLTKQSADIDQLMNTNENFNRRALLNTATLNRSGKSKYSTQGNRKLKLNNNPGRLGGFSGQESRKRQTKPYLKGPIKEADDANELADENNGDDGYGDAEKASDRRADSFDLDDNSSNHNRDSNRNSNSNDNENDKDEDSSVDNDSDEDEDNGRAADAGSSARANPRRRLKQAASKQHSGRSKVVTGKRARGNLGSAKLNDNDDDTEEDTESTNTRRVTAVSTKGLESHKTWPLKVVEVVHEPTVADSLAGNDAKHGLTDLQTAAGHHHGHSHSHYYQYVEVPKKKSWKFGFKRGNHKHEISRHEKGHKSKFHSSFHWHAKEKCKKKHKCKSVGKMTWEYKHHDKKHHG